MDLTINKGIGIVLSLVFLSVGLLVLGQLGIGSVGTDGKSSSYWYGINNQNTTGANCYAGGCFANGTISGGVSLLQSVVLPIMAAIAVIVVVLLAALKVAKGK